MPAVIDSHCHLDFPDFGAELPAVLDRARQAGIVAMISIGAGQDLAPARAAVALAAREPDVFATVGIHPHDVATMSEETWRELEGLARAPRVVGIGETGLDFYYDRSPREVQRERFAEQIRLAKRLLKPLVVHTREADEDTAALLEQELGPQGGVVHCFTGDWKAAQRYLGLGLHISLSGVLTFKAADALRDAARRIPLERLLVETDCPFLAPVPHRGKRNEPAYVAFTATRLAELRGESLGEIERVTTANARRALHLNNGPPSGIQGTP